MGAPGPRKGIFPPFFSRFLTTFFQPVYADDGRMERSSYAKRP
jgi:hypothetical protein